MNQSLYSGDCPHCRKFVRAGLSFSQEMIPPPVLTVGCGCSIPPTELQLIYFGAHTDASGVKSKDVLKLDWP